jgi:hypothetical protein
MRMAGSPSFTPADKTRMREALQTFSKNVGREFTSEEQSAILLTLLNAGGIGKMLSPMDARCWQAAFILSKTVGRVAHEAKPKPEEKEKVHLEPAPPTKEELQKEYRTRIVVKWRGNLLTKADLDRKLGGDYKTVLNKGDGELVLNTDQLRPGRTR